MLVVVLDQVAVGNTHWVWSCHPPKPKGNQPKEMVALNIKDLIMLGMGGLGDHNRYGHVIGHVIFPFPRATQRNVGWKMFSIS